MPLLRSYEPSSRSPADDSFAVCVENVSRHFGQGASAAVALDDVSFRIPASGFAVLTGPSGSGKTTLLNLIGCLDRPTSGRILIAQKDTSGFDERRMTAFRAETLGFVFQNYNLLPVLTAFENVEFPLRLIEPDRQRRRRMVGEMLERVGLGGLSHRKPAQLSGGQQQRVAVARALVKSPALVLADEPTANLDERTAIALIETMRALQREIGTTFLFSSHDPRLIGEADTHIEIANGHLSALHQGSRSLAPVKETRA
ncbi:ABC transporter ATP-binding protein [Nguyenibacter vanlangensis]|uniref:ABC transporter ATP-binding protein n=1 Tax=Nguyenibacter vanlangensis TaxID=1216886 RepID=A0ABZ3DBD9_9PROT